MSEKYVHQRGENYVFRRRVPIEVRELDPRTSVKISLKTKNYSKAVTRAAIYNEQMERYWRDLLREGKKDRGLTRYKTTVELCKAMGFSYMPADTISQQPLSDVLTRLEHKLTNEMEAKAILGGQNECGIKLSDCVELFEPLIQDRLVGKTDHQIRKYMNPRKLAMRLFIETISDKFIHEITRKDVLDFRSFLSERIKQGKSGGFANKNLIHLKDILRLVSNHYEIDLDADALFVNTKFKTISKSRRPYDARFVENTLLTNLGGISREYAMVLHAMADTGARIGEIFGLREEDIILEEPIPYIHIRPYDGHMLKTRTSERQIPLVGSALKAFLKYPKGFSHKGNPDSFSGSVNKYLENHGLRPSKDHSIYSLRHTFKDKLRDIEAPEEIILELMGHASNSPRYGRGRRLEDKQRWLEKCAYKVL